MREVKTKSYRDGRARSKCPGRVTEEWGPRARTAANASSIQHYLKWNNAGCSWHVAMSSRKG